MTKVLDRVHTGEIKRLIINVPPGYTKTELAVINFIIKGFLINPRSRFLHTSYSDNLALKNSGIVKRIIEEDQLFQAMQPMKIRSDTKAKRQWNNEFGGGVVAAASGGQVTGFRAGLMDKDKFTGASLIDDPGKPEEAHSKVARLGVTDTYTSTVKNRLATEEVPIVGIMQRTHEEDLSGFLLRGGSNEKWHHLNLPAYIKKHPDPYPKDYKFGIPIPFDLPIGPLWEYKHSIEELRLIKKSNSFVWHSQFMQAPTSISGSIIKREWFPYYRSIDLVNSKIILENGETVDIDYITSHSDTALKPGERNDFTVFTTWVAGKDGRIYLMTRIKDKLDSVDLEKNFIRYLKRLKYTHGVNNVGIRSICVEDKASGIGLIQSINKKLGNREDDYDLTGLPKITPTPRSTDKVSRGLSAAPSIEKGLVVLPVNAPWVDDYQDEVCAFNANMTHKFDDQCDVTWDAVQTMLIDRQTVDYDKLVGN